jgi:hypothetical protein
MLSPLVTFPRARQDGLMQTLDFVRDSLSRVHDLIPAVLDGLSGDDLLWRPDPEANSLGWLIWHLCRIEDDHLAALGHIEQVWTGDGWYQRFGLPYVKTAQGFRMTPTEVGMFNTRDARLLSGYAAAVWSQTGAILESLTDDDVDTVIDRRWTPPVTIGIRLASVVVETSQHVGQAGYVRGLRERTVGINSGWAGTA